MIAQMLLQVFWKATNVGTDGLSLVQLSGRKDDGISQVETIIYIVALIAGGVIFIMMQFLNVRKLDLYSQIPKVRGNRVGAEDAEAGKGGHRLDVEGADRVLFLGNAEMLDVPTLEAVRAAVAVEVRIEALTLMEIFAHVFPMLIVNTGILGGIGMREGAVGEDLVVLYGSTLWSAATLGFNASALSRLVASRRALQQVNAAIERAGSFALATPASGGGTSGPAHHDIHKLEGGGPAVLRSSVIPGVPAYLGPAPKGPLLAPLGANASHKLPPLGPPKAPVPAEGGAAAVPGGMGVAGNLSVRNLRNNPSASPAKPPGSTGDGLSPAPPPHPAFLPPRPSTPLTSAAPSPMSSAHFERPGGAETENPGSSVGVRGPRSPPPRPVGSPPPSHHAIPPDPPARKRVDGLPGIEGEGDDSFVQEVDEGLEGADSPGSEGGGWGGKGPPEPAKKPPAARALELARGGDGPGPEGPGRDEAGTPGSTTSSIKSPRVGIYVGGVFYGDNGPPASDPGRRPPLSVPAGRAPPASAVTRPATAAVAAGGPAATARPASAAGAFQGGGGGGAGAGGLGADNDRLRAAFEALEADIDSVAPPPPEDEPLMSSYLITRARQDTGGGLEPPVPTPYYYPGLSLGRSAEVSGAGGGKKKKLRPKSAKTTGGKKGSRPKSSGTRGS